MYYVHILTYCIEETLLSIGKITGFNQDRNYMECQVQVYTSLFKFLQEVSYAQHRCTYQMKNTVKIII